MADPELAALRARRLAELQGGAAAGGGGAGLPGGFNSQADAQRKQKESEDEEKMDYILRQILDSDAHDRLKRISIVKPEKAKAIGNSLVAMAQTGRLAGRVSENQLIQLLEQQGGTERGPKVTIQHKHMVGSLEDSESSSDESD